MRTVLSISLPEQISQELNRFAKNTGRNKSDIVKESISLYLWESRLSHFKKRLSS